MSEQQPLDLALLWHMHQPSYRDPVSGEIALPWVRLHSTRAYFDMAWLLERHPQIKATFNFVPILLEQLESYIERGERDRYWHLSYKSADELTSAEIGVITQQFFSVHLETGIKPRARYWSLYRRFKEASAQDVQTPEAADLRDLQVLFNLAWFGYATRVEFPLIDELDRKGRDFTEEEKRKLLDLQIEVMRRLLPLYRNLASRGQIELTSTPYYHPILPLILDSEVAARCQPNSPRPPQFSWPEDANAHVARAIEAHQRAFGMPPAGMWPAEGSVSPEVAALLARHGVRWIASDEAQLWNSQKGKNLSRDELFHAYRVEHEGQQISMVFRDRGISDALGFTYSRNPANVSVEDFVRNAHVIHSTLPKDERGLLVVALDGENPWEYYEQSGRPFLECLYGMLEKDQSIRTVRIGDHLDANPPKRKIEHLHTGSWINSDFGIWIGGSIENRAWKRLGEARRFFEEVRSTLTDEAKKEAYEHLLQAEGSDWFWWYGEPFHSENDDEFDYLFRAHLRQVYAICGVEPPPVLDRSLYPPKASAAARLPTFFVTPRFTGDQPSTYFDWLGAGCYELASACSSMYQAAKFFDKFLYGFDLKNVYLRFEALSDLAAEDLNLRIRFYGAQEYCAEIPLQQLSQATLYRLNDEQKLCNPVPINMICMRGSVIELGVPFDALGLTTGNVLRFSAHLLRNRVELERAPMGELAQVTVPTPSFEEIRQWP